MQEIRLSNKTNKLELDPYSYQLQDVESPELFREMFPYTETPKIAFNYRRVPENMPEDIFITDTTFRDGQQSRAPYTMEQMVHIYKLLHELGGPNGMIRQTEFFVYSEKDRKALEKCMELGYEFPEITTWIRANKIHWCQGDGRACELFGLPYLSQDGTDKEAGIRQIPWNRVRLHRSRTPSKMPF